MSVTPVVFALEDYKQKIRYLAAHFTRMWTRFNYFVAIETALVGGKFLIPNNVSSRALTIAGVLISAVWYLMGAEDRYLVRLYRFQVKELVKVLAQRILSDEKAQKQVARRDERQRYLDAVQAMPAVDEWPVRLRYVRL